MKEKLKQSPTFRPFPGKLTTFTQVTSSASDNQITDVISWNVSPRYTTQGKRMVNVEFAPFYLFLAVVTLPFLSIILLTNLLCSISSLDRHFPRSTITNIRECYHLAFFGVLVVPMPFLIMLFMHFPIQLIPFSTLLCIRYMTRWTLPALLLEVFRVFLTISFVVFSQIPSTSRVILFDLINIVSSVTFLALFDFFPVGITIYFTLCTYLIFMSLIMQLFIHSRTFLAVRLNPICTCLFSGKMLRSCRKKLFARPCAAFQGRIRRVIHDLNCLSLSLPWFFWLSGCKAYIFSPGVITPKLDNHTKYTFFLPRRKAEV